MAILTEQQLEIAAREYCRLADIDPDKETDVSIPGLHHMVHAKQSVPMWKVCVNSIREQNITNEAIVFAQNSKRE